MKQNIYDDNKETKTTQLHVIYGQDHYHAQTNCYSSYGSEFTHSSWFKNASRQIAYIPA